MKLLRGFCILLSLVVLSSCATEKGTQFGVQPDQLAHVPAMSAILPCRIWPQTALFPKLSATDLPAAESAAVCAAFEKFILEGFTDQPYMRGLSPNVVQQLLKKKGKEGTLAELDSHWARSGKACSSCQNAPDYYSKVVAPDTAWRQWLNSFSRTAADADSLLIPFVSEAKMGVINDRGLFYAIRSASVVLLLVDSNNGDLIWAGRNQAESRIPLPERPADESKVQLPAWEDVFKRLFQNDIWLDFPGRQN